MNIAGEELPQVMSGLELLQKVELGENVDFGKHVVVVGGGNTAIDLRSYSHSPARSREG